MGPSSSSLLPPSEDPQARMAVLGKKAAGPKAKKKAQTFVIDCSKPVDDKIMDIASFEKFLQDKIKVNGNAGALGEVIKVSRERSKIVVKAENTREGNKMVVK